MDKEYELKMKKYFENADWSLPKSREQVEMAFKAGYVTCKDSISHDAVLGEVTEIINELHNNNMKGKLKDRNDVAYHAGYYNALKDLKEKISGISA